MTRFSSLNQKAFTMIEGLLIVVIVAILGGTGWYVYHATNQSGDTLQQANLTAQTTATPKKAKKAVTSAPATTTYSQVPKALQEAILAVTQKEVPACVKDGGIVDFNGQPIDISITYDPAGFAIVPVGCDGGAQHLFVLRGNTWSDVEHTQFAFSCDTLKKNHIPVALLTVGRDSASDPTQCVPTPADNNAPLSHYAG